MGLTREKMLLGFYTVVTECTLRLFFPMQCHHAILVLFSLQKRRLNVKDIKKKCNVFSTMRASRRKFWDLFFFNLLLMLFPVLACYTYSIIKCKHNTMNTSFKKQEKLIRQTFPMIHNLKSRNTSSNLFIFSILRLAGANSQDSNPFSTVPCQMLYAYTICTLKKITHLFKSNPNAPGAVTKVCKNARAKFGPQREKLLVLVLPITLQRLLDRT